MTFDQIILLVPLVALVGFAIALGLYARHQKRKDEAKKQTHRPHAPDVQYDPAAILRSKAAGEAFRSDQTRGGF